MKELRSYTKWNFKTRALKGERAMKDLGNEFDTCMVRGMCETVACSNRSRSHFVHNFISTRVKKRPRNQHKTPFIYFLRQGGIFGVASLGLDQPGTIITIFGNWLASKESCKVS